MSKTTIRKRISLVVISALTVGVMSVVSSPAALATHPAAGSSNADAAIGTENGSLFVGTRTNTTGVAAVSATSTSVASVDGNALSLGLLSKDTSSGTAQTVTMLAGGKLSLYANVATAAAFTASAGSFASTSGGDAGNLTAAYSNDLKQTYPGLVTAATGVATIWTAPSTVGTYTVSLYTGFASTSSGSSTKVAPSPTYGTGSTLSGNITVTVVASSAGGSVSLAYSACNTSAASTAITAGVAPAGVDTTSIFADGDAAYVNFDLNDAYIADLSAGNLVATATNGGLVNFGTGGSAVSAGTSSTDVAYDDGVGETVRIDQPTSGAPLTTTVTITFNGTTVCTKTVTIRGKATKLTVAHVGTQALSTPSTTGSAQWMYQHGTGISDAGALFSVVATDSAGNVVSTPGTYGTYSADSATLTTTVQAISVNTRSTTASASSTSRYNYGSWTCGSDAGKANVKIKLTLTATGDVISSDAFEARCAGSPYTYTASLDKASYTQGDIATATVKFLDSKGNPSNSVATPGTGTWTLPYMTGVSFTLPTTTSTGVTKADGTLTYTFTVGTSSGLTAGTYTGIVEYASLAVSAKSTPTYKLSTGGDSTTNADVLKSIVALIASINKQIQALQKLILKR